MLQTVKAQAPTNTSLLSYSAQGVGYSIKEHHFLAFRPMLFSLMSFGLTMDQLLLSSCLPLPFGMPAPPLYFGSKDHSRRKQVSGWKPWNATHFWFGWDWTWTFQLMLYCDFFQICETFYNEILWSELLQNIQWPFFLLSLVPPEVRITGMYHHTPDMLKFS